MINAARLAEKLRDGGVQPPPRPVPPFDVLPTDPTDHEIELDRAYQAACAAWIEAVGALYRLHFPTA